MSKYAELGGQWTSSAIFDAVQDQMRSLVDQGQPAVQRKLVERRLQAVRKAGGLVFSEGFWRVPAAKAVKAAPRSTLFKLDVTTYRPEKYVLFNLEDGTAFQGVRVVSSERGSWERLKPEEALQTLVGVAKGTVFHRSQGSCPTDCYAGVNDRDPQCPVCQAVTALELRSA